MKKKVKSSRVKKKAIKKKSDLLSKQLLIRCSPKEAKALRAGAKHHDMYISRYIRSLLIKGAKRWMV